MCDKFKDHILAGSPLLWIETHEEHRALTVFAQEMDTCRDKINLFAWDCVDGVKLRQFKNGVLGSAAVKDPKYEDLSDPLIALDWAEKAMPENSVLFLLDWHCYAKKTALCRKVRNLLPIFKSTGKSLAVISYAIELPPELEKDVTVVPFELPTASDLRKVLKGLCESAKSPYPKEDEPIIEAALGMTSFEAETAYALSLIRTKGFDSAVVRKEKAAIVRKTGLLEVVDSKISMDDVGGLENVKAWLKTREGIFTEKARKFGATPPKGMLLVGVPGTGKSLIAKAVASALHRPLLRLDMGKVYGSYVGESESRIRQVLSMCEAVAPCVLFIDEMEKAFAGTQEGESDGHGTTKRVFGTFLTWMQERVADVFIVATANDVKSLPAALLRSGRIDAKFWVDLPGTEQRKEILSIHMKKTDRNPKKFDLDLLSKTCEGLTGAEIEEWTKEAIIHAFAADEELRVEDYVATIGEITPIARMMKQQIEESRTWADGHGIKPASTTEVKIEVIPVIRRLGNVGLN